MASFEDAYKEYEKSNRGQTVAGMYDAQRDTGLASLKTAYEQNLSNRRAARDQIGTTYRGQANDLQAQYERNRRNLNTQAAANGINTGAGSQQRLALNSNYQRDYGALRGREAQDIAEANRGIADLKVAYQNAVQQANAEGDYKKMAALLQDYQSERQRQLQDAQLMANYGIFDGYRGLYGDDAVNTMRNLWIAQNPLLAYNTGAIDANRYYQMTGLQAPGVTAPTPAAGGGRDLTWVPAPTPTEEPSTEPPATGPVPEDYDMTTQKGTDDYLKDLVKDGQIDMREATELRDQLSHPTQTASTTGTPAKSGANNRGTGKTRDMEQ